LIAIVLAGGYATRLQALCNDVPKPLLKVAGKPIVGHIFDKLAEVEDVRHVIISTNLRFQDQFRAWLDSNPRNGAEIVVDRSCCEEEKLGAVASLAQTTSTIDDDCLIVAGDNFFTSSLRPMFHDFRKRSSPVIALYDVKDVELARQYSTVTMSPEPSR